MRDPMPLSRKVFRLLTLVGVLLSIPTLGVAQCGSPDFLKVHHLWRVGFNNVEALAGTQVVGDYWYNWDTYVESTERLDGALLHYGTDTGIGGLSGVQWNDAPSAVGVGAYTTSNYHRAVCDVNQTEDTSSDALTVSDPTIGNLPYNSALWYFGPGTPDAVPTGIGYAYQMANLTFNKNCNVGDTCTGTAAWSELDPPNNISVSSAGQLRSTSGGTCAYDSAVRATLDGWTVTDPIAVNSPEFLWHPEDEETLPHDSGYKTREYWSIGDACVPDPNSVPSVAVREEFGQFSNPGVVEGWPDPSITHNPGFNHTTWSFFDSIGAWGSYDPAPTFTSGSPPYTHNDILKYAPQRWFAGSEDPGAGRQVFSGTIRYYLDHGDSQ